MSDSDSVRCGCWRCENSTSTVSSNFHDISEEQEAQTSWIDAQVERIQHDTITALLEHCAALSRKRNALLPGVNLPFEILVMIFEIACLPSDDEGRFSTIIGADFWQKAMTDYPNPSRAFVPGPLFIAQVCSAWRQVAHNAPQLWNSIKLLVDNKHAEEQASILQYWLSHSGQLPLAVGLMEPLEYHAIASKFQQYDMPTTVIDVLAPYAHRLHTAELVMTDKWEPALIHIRKCASRLACLNLDKPSETHFIKCVNFFAETPLLRDVTVLGYNLMDDGSLVLPLAQIERLFTEIVVETFNPVEALRKCPKLRHCTLDTHSYGIPFNLSLQHPLMHGTLQSLNLIIRNEKDLEDLLDLLTLPMLHTFEVDLEELSPLVFSIQSLFTRSSCALEKLHLFGVIIPEDDLVELLQALPELRDLLLRLHQWDDEIYPKLLDLMSPRKFARESPSGVDTGTGVDERSNGQCVVPNLEILYYDGDITLDSHALLEFLAGRWENQQNTNGLPEEKVAPKRNTPARLHSATFKNAQIQLEDDDIVILRRLRQEGMHVKIGDY